MCKVKLSSFFLGCDHKKNIYAQGGKFLHFFLYFPDNLFIYQSVPSLTTPRAIPGNFLSVAMLIGGALANALAFTGSSYLFHRLSADNIDAERKRHDAAIEALQKAQIEWIHKRQQRIDFINNQLRLERKAETKFTELNEAMREYHEVFGHELPPLP